MKCNMRIITRKETKQTWYDPPTRISPCTDASLLLFGSNDTNEKKISVNDCISHSRKVRISLIKRIVHLPLRINKYFISMKKNQRN